MEFVIGTVLFVVALGYLWYKRENVLNGFEEGVEELAEAVEEVREELEEVELPSKNKLMKMKKDDIEQVGRTFGIELDKRFTKEKMVNKLHKEVEGND